MLGYQLMMNYTHVLGSWEGAGWPKCVQDIVWVYVGDGFDNRRSILVQLTHHRPGLLQGPPGLGLGDPSLKPVWWGLLGAFNDLCKLWYSSGSVSIRRYSRDLPCRACIDTCGCIDVTSCLMLTYPYPQVKVDLM